MKKPLYFLIISFILIHTANCQKLFFEDFNGDKRADIVSITIENLREFKIKLLYSGDKIWKFDYLNEFNFTSSYNIDSYTIADINGNGRAELVLFQDENNHKNVRFFSIEPDEVVYLGHTLLPNKSDAKEYFVDINDDQKKELILVENEAVNKKISSYEFTSNDFHLLDSLSLSNNIRKEHFADITGDGKEDLILSQDYGADKRLWVLKSIGTTFEYLAYTNLISGSGKEVSFINSHSEKDNFYDLVLSTNTSEGKKLWIHESDGARFSNEVSAIFSYQNNRNVLYGDIDNNGTDDLITTNTTNDIWSYENKENTFTYRLHSPLLSNKAIDTGRTVDWHNAGYHNGSSVPQSFANYLNMPSPNSDPRVNLENFRLKLAEAVSMKSALPNQHIVIKFQQGIYTFDESIILEPQHSFIVLQGQGTKASDINTFTELVYNINPQDTSPNHFIRIRGNGPYPSNTEIAPIVLNYNKASNEVTLNKPLSTVDKPDYMIDLVFTNGTWHNSGTPDNEYVGFISSKNLVSGATYKLEKDFDLSWDLFKQEGNTVKALTFEPIKEIGLLDLSIRYNSEFENVPKANLQSTLISIDKAQNCWIDNIEVSKVLSAAVGVHESLNVAILNSYFHEAYGYGVGGRGYGVVIDKRSTHCKVENNIFRKFRHAMLVAYGSNRNVFGYNYSREQTDEENNNLADLNLHGFYPYANLYEGNRVDRIDADQRGGSNGAFNTFFRNYTYHNQLKVNGTLYSNIVGNENASIFGSEETAFELNNYTYEVYTNMILTEQHHYLPNESYYLNEMPVFFNNYINSSVSWPAIGPPLLDTQLLHNIPARERWLALPENNFQNLKISTIESGIIDEKKIIPYPNPIKDGVLMLKISEALPLIDNIKIYSLDGQLVYNENISPTTNKNIKIDVSILKRGIYMISVVIFDNIVTERLIIQ